MKRQSPKNNSPKISIVVPVLNNEQFLPETLDSLVNQTYKNFEVIIQDGKSTDNTLKIAKNYVKRFPKTFRLYSEKDNGQYDAINKGFKKATGAIFAFLNSDDLYNKHTLHLIKEAYLKNKDALWFAGYGAVIDDKGTETAKVVTLYKNMLLKINSFNTLITVNYLMQPSVFITKKAYEKYGPVPGVRKFLREYDLWMQIGKDQMPVVIPKTLSYFRLSKNMISASKFKEIAEDDLNTAKKYSNNQILLFLRWVHNKARGLFIP